MAMEKSVDRGEGSSSRSRSETDPRGMDGSRMEERGCTAERVHFYWSASLLRDAGGRQRTDTQSIILTTLSQLSSQQPAAATTPFCACPCLPGRGYNHQFRVPHWQCYIGT
jgi:hypothetical protein